MAVSGFEGLERLRDLQTDLTSLADSRLVNIERLVAELETHIDDFRRLLDKKPKTDASRKELLSGTVTIDDVEYSLNDDFRQEVLEITDLLDLDELEATKLYLQAQEYAQLVDRSPRAASILLFHERRQFLVDCLRLSFQQAVDTEESDDTTRVFGELITLVLHGADGTAEGGGGGGGSRFWKRCLETMSYIEHWLQRISERVQSVSITGQVESTEFAEVMRIQRDSLTRQHECLAAICHYLVVSNYTKTDDFRTLLTKLKTIDRYDVTTVHYIPQLCSFISHFGPSLDTCPASEAKALNDLILGNKDQDSWGLRNLHATTIVLWLVEYSARHIDYTGTLLPENTDLEAEDEQRSTSFMEALRDGALQFMLAFSQDIRERSWSDPTRRELLLYLAKDSPSFQIESTGADSFFENLLMQRMQSFIESFITYMPNTLRKLKWEEDEQRRNLLGRSQMPVADYELHLERFLILISYAFEGSQGAAEAFWADVDSNLYGFLQWAAQRHSTPRAAAFCEMLRALSDSEPNANFAHQFLLEDGTSTTNKLNRSSPMSWAQIFTELDFFASTIRERTTQQGKAHPSQYLEPESTTMIRFYLRLFAHVCGNSPDARAWVSTQSAFSVHSNLLVLSSGSVDGHIRAGAFQALTSLLAHKTQQTSDNMWAQFDAWAFGQPGPGSQSNARSQAQGMGAQGDNFFFELIAREFDDSSAFAGLMYTLVSPFDDASHLNDWLPFPESLGSAYRMPGIEPYVDFVLGRLFATRSNELHHQREALLLRLSCLDFAAVCLRTFNDDLVIFANKASISVDSAMQTSSLATYARLHPFARVMEWFFNDRVLSSLFACVIQDPDSINRAEADSPQVMGLVRGIEVIDYILTKQGTYFDIVRPIIKTQSNSRRQAVANAALASFEDAILSKLDFVTYLGLYCGSGHRDLVSLSLKLLQKLSVSRKLTAPVSTVNSRSVGKSRLLNAFERNSQAETISRSLIAEMAFSERQIEQGPESPGYVIKSEILKFLNDCIAASPDHPTIAHALLGFTCQATTINVPDDGLFSAGRSLFHSIVGLTLDTPFGEAGVMVYWLIHIKEQATRLMRRLCKSPLSARLVLPELRAMDFFFMQWAQQPLIGLDTSWDGKTLEDAEFFIDPAAVGLAGFLYQRIATLEYAASELRFAAANGMETIRTRMSLSLLGQTTFSDGTNVTNTTLFEMLDFLDMDNGSYLTLPESRFLDAANFEICKEIENDTSPRYSLQSAEQLLELRKSELQKQGQLVLAADQEQLEADAYNTLLCLSANNARSEVETARMSNLKAWIQLVSVVLQNCNLEQDQKNAFVLQTLQLVLPRLERSLYQDLQAAVLFASLCSMLVQYVEGDGKTHNIAGDAAEEKMFHLFETALLGVKQPEAPASLRDICCQICQSYLRRISAKSPFSKQRRAAIQRIKSMGDHLLRVLCDDAQSADGPSKSSALVLLAAIVSVSNEENSRYIIEAFVRWNFLEIMIDNIRSIPSDLRGTSDVSQLLTNHLVNLSLLLRISQTRFGAAYVLNAGLFSAIRQSGLFNADPDIGIELENATALARYFQLLLSVLKVVNAACLSCGAENEQTVAQARQFIREYRLSIMAIFKRNAKIGHLGKQNEKVVAELVDNFTLTISYCGFIESEEETTPARESGRVFS